MMATLQDYIRHRSAKPSSRPDSPQKFGAPASRIPLSRSDIAKGLADNNNNNNSNYQSIDENLNENHHQKQLQDEQDYNDTDFDTRDSELESLANLDHRGFDNDSSDGEGSFDGGELLDADGEPLGVNGKGGWLNSNGNDFDHQGGSSGSYIAQDDRSDGTSTPQPRNLSDEENLQRDAAAQFNRGMGHNQINENNTGEDDLPQQFYTSLEIDQKREENNRSNPRSSAEVKNNLLGGAGAGAASSSNGNQNGIGSGSGTMRRRSKDRFGTVRGGGGGGGGDRSWQDLDDEFRKSGGRIDGESIPFDIDGMLEMLGQRLKLSLRGSARLNVTDFWFPYKILTIQSPSLPYYIFIPPTPHTALEVARMTSDIATMAFVRRYHPSIPVPEVVYYDTDVNNLAGVPFFATKAIHGQFLGYPDPKDITSDRRAMMGLLDQLARIHAELLKPPRGFTPTHIGNITFRKDSGGTGVGAGASGVAGSSAAVAAAAGKNAFVTGPLLVTMDDDSELLDGPSSSSLSPSSSSPSGSGGLTAAAAAAAVSSLPDLCMHLFQVSESRTLMDPPQDAKSLRDLRSVKRRLAGLLGILPQLPTRLSQLSLFHSNLNLSSVVIDPRTRAITCVPIWRDACILPFALAVSYPREIRPRNTEWRIWVDDATNSMSGGRVDENFGYRGVYDARLAKYDLRFASDVWEDEELGRWVKVYELVGGGWRMWVDRVGWIEAELDRVRRM